MSSIKDSRPVGYLLERTTRIVKLKFHKTFKEIGIELTPEQWVIIDTINANPGMLQKDLADSSFKNAPTISRILDVLSKKEWIRRLPHQTDKRAYNIELTEEGQQVYDVIKPEVDALRQMGWDGLTDEEYVMFTSIVDKIFENYS